VRGMQLVLQEERRQELQVQVGSIQHREEETVLYFTGPLHAIFHWSITSHISLFTSNILPVVSVWLILH
jgi:hypothetical protein